MRITKDDAEFATALVIKDGAPLGLVQEIDTYKKWYRKLVIPPEGTDNPGVEEGTYDRVVMCLDEHPSFEVRRMPNMIKNVCRGSGIEFLSKEEMDALRKEIGVVL